MKTAFRAVLAGLVLAAVASPAAAQTETIKLTSTGSKTWNGYYVGPYQAQVISQPGSPTIDIYCVDFQHTVSVGQQWDATYSNVMGDLSNTRAGLAYGETKARTMYQQAAYLTTFYATANSSQTGAINSAIWNIFYTGAPDKGGSGANSSSYWLTQAQNNYATAGIDYRTFAVVTDVKFELGGKQEFLTTVTATPEPSTYLMMASGLIGLAGLGYRRRRSEQS